MILLTLILFSGAALDKLSPGSRQEIERLNSAYGSDLKQIVETMGPDKKATIISWLKEGLKDPSGSPFSEEIRLLIDLGDEDTIASEARTFPSARFGGGSDLYYSTQPKVIPALAPILFINEPYRRTGTPDAPSDPRSFEAADAIRRILDQSPYFSTKVNKWAASWEDLPGANNYQFRDVMRNWWNTNKWYFENGNYAAVQPGVAPPKVPVASEQAKSSATRAPSVTAMEASSAPSAGPTAAKVSSNDSGSEERTLDRSTVHPASKWPIWVGIGSLVLLIAGFTILRRK